MLQTVFRLMGVIHMSQFMSPVLDNMLSLPKWDDVRSIKPYNQMVWSTKISRLVTKSLVLFASFVNSELIQPSESPMQSFPIMFTRLCRGAKVLGSSASTGGLVDHKVQQRRR